MARIQWTAGSGPDARDRVLALRNPVCRRKKHIIARKLMKHLYARGGLSCDPISLRFNNSFEQGPRGPRVAESWSARCPQFLELLNDRTRCLFVEGITRFANHGKKNVQINTYLGSRLKSCEYSVSIRFRGSPHRSQLGDDRIQRDLSGRFFREFRARRVFRQPRPKCAIRHGSKRPFTTTTLGLCATPSAVPSNSEHSRDCRPASSPQDR